MATLLRIPVRNTKRETIGTRFGVQVTTQGGGRRTIGIGRMSERDAERFRDNVAELESLRRQGRSPDLNTARWLGNLSDAVHRALANAGLVPPRTPNKPAPIVPTLEIWVDRLLEQRRADHAERTRELYASVRDSLTRQFGTNRPLDYFTPAHAEDWRAALARSGKGEAVRRMYARTAKAVFNAAVDQEVLARNPFNKLPTASIAAERERHVSAADSAKVLAALPPGPQRIIFALARYAGLRVPSETRGLRWSDMAWDQNKLSVYAPKTKTRRVVPVCPELLSVLQDSFDSAPEGAEFIAPLKSAGSLARVIRSAIQRAGVTPSPRLMQACRQACETDWLDRFPSHVAAAWLGHSALVQQKHYAQVTDAHFNAASAPYAIGMQTGDARPCRTEPSNPVGTIVRHDAHVSTCPGSAYESPALTAELRGRGGPSVSGSHTPRARGPQEATAVRAGPGRVSVTLVYATWNPIRCALRTVPTRGRAEIVEKPAPCAAAHSRRSAISACCTPRRRNGASTLKPYSVEIGPETSTDPAPIHRFPTNAPNSVVLGWWAHRSQVSTSSGRTGSSSGVKPDATTVAQSSTIDVSDGSTRRMFSPSSVDGRIGATRSPGFTVRTKTLSNTRMTNLESAR